jgi:hypothetical protein
MTLEGLVGLLHRLNPAWSAVKIAREAGCSIDEAQRIARRNQYVLPPSDAQRGVNAWRLATAVDALLDLDDDTPAAIVAKAHARARRAVAYYEGRRVRHV